MQKPQESLLQLHRIIDQLTEPLRQRHSARLQCRRGCSNCCVDDLRIFSIEADRIVQEHKLLLTNGTAHARGACAFLSEDGACRIYASRPYVCRTQGLPLRWLEVVEHEDVVERRDICSLNIVGEAIENLREEECWTIGPVESKLRELEDAYTHGQPKRVALRDLFVNRLSNAG